MFLMGTKILIYLYCLLLEVQYYPLVVHCLLTYYEVIHWHLVSWAILYNVRLKADLLAGQVLHKRDFNMSLTLSVTKAPLEVPWD